MGKIDDPLDQIEFVHRDAHDLSKLSVSLAFAAPLIAALNGGAGVVTGFLSAATSLFSQERVTKRLEAADEGLTEGFRAHEGRLADVEKNLAMPLAEEAAIVLVGAVARTSRLEKAKN